MSVGWQLLWEICGVATVVAAVLAGRRTWARYLGRVAVGLLFLVGGALAHLVNLATGVSYARFADPAWFGWVSDSWRAVVVPRQVWFIGLLVVFEAVVGALVLSGGRRTRLGLAGVIAFYLLLWLFGWMEAVWCLVMLPATVLLLRAERCPSQRPLTSGPQVRPKVAVGSGDAARARRP
jgi:hypothetical protein